MLKSEAGAAGQRPKRHLYVLLHDDVEAAHQRPEGEKNVSVNTNCSL